MQYALTGLGTHLDFGFGVTGESYHLSGDFLLKNQGEIKAFQQVSMPACFVLRHSIELFLKSLIIIFHKKLKINYGDEDFNSQNPKILSNGKWKELFNCHWIDELYNYWLKELLVKHKQELDTMVPLGDWQEIVEMTSLIRLITKYDRDSSFFRYPVTRNSSLDEEKFSMQRVDVESVQELIEKEGKMNDEVKSGLFMVIKDENELIAHAFRLDRTAMVEVSQSLKKVSHYFYCIHMMTRMTLCKGN